MAPQESTQQPPETSAETSAEQDPNEAIGLGKIPQPNINRYDGEIVVAGISGKYPMSDDLDEFEDNLINGVNMVGNEARWEPGHMGLKSVMGKIRHIEHFDAQFFSITPKACEVTDPQQRVLLEVVYEAIIDSGYTPQDLRGLRTGVYVGCGMSDAEDAWLVPEKPYAVMGTLHSIMPNRVSYVFGFNGPSIEYDTACSSCIVAQEAAEQHMRMGVIDAAIIGTVNFLMRPNTFFHFKNMNMLGSEASKAFDASSDGFVRSEGCGAFLMMRKDLAKRNYATIVGTLTNNDGYKREGIMYPGTFAQEQLIRDVYHNFNIDVDDIKWFETHGTGTPAGDPVEANAIDRAVCSRKKDPLLVTSTKSNCGHCELSSGLTSVTRVCLNMERGEINANLHFKTPNPKIPALLEGRMKICTEPTPYNEGDLCSINSFGMTGTNGHTVLKSTNKRRTEPHPASNVPRLFVYSARTEEGVKGILEKAHAHADNVDFHALCQGSANPSLKSMPYRGATILNGTQKFTEVQKVASKPREVWFMYAGVGSQWVGMGRCLMQLEAFRNSMEEIAGYLKPMNIDLMDLIMNTTEEKLKFLSAPFVCINSIQVAITDLLTSMGIKPDGIIGHSLGEVAAAYADGCISKKESILAACFRGTIMIENPPPPGQMAAVGMTWEEVKAQCPKGVIAACHNGENSVTISGKMEPTKKWMKELEAKGVFVRGVQSNDIAYHSEDMKPLGPAIVEKLNGIGMKSVPRSKKWISTSWLEEDWENPHCKMSGPEYNANNLYSPVYLYEAMQKVPKNAIVIEIAPAAIFQSIIKKTLGDDCTVVGLQKRGSDANLHMFYSSLGKCYASGVAMNPMAVLPPVQFPVPRGTPGLSGMISRQWDHSQEWPIPLYTDFVKKYGDDDGVQFQVDCSEGGDDEYLMDHALDGRALFPGMGSVVLAWRALASQRNIEYETMPVQLTNVQIHQAMFLSTSATATVTAYVSQSDGAFKIMEGESLLATGNITAPEGEYFESAWYTQKSSNLEGKSKTEVLSRNEVYREFIIRGYEYGPKFQGIAQCSVDGTDSDIQFNGQWISYLDAALQMIILARPGSEKMLPIKMDVINIDPTVNPRAAKEGEDPTILPGHYDAALGLISVGGIEIKGITCITANRQLTHAPSCQEDFLFVPFTDVQEDERSSALPTPLIREYADALSEYARQGLSQLISKKKFELSCKDRIVECLDNANKSAGKAATANYAAAKAALGKVSEKINKLNGPRALLSNVLEVLYELPFSKGEREQVLGRLHDARFNYFDDILPLTLESADILKPMFDTVSENLNKNVVDILEIGARSSVFFRQAIPKALKYTHIHDYKYTVCDTWFVDDAEDYPAKQLKFDIKDPSNYPDVHDESFDMVIMKQFLHIHEDLDVAIIAIDKMLRPGGFVLLEEYTQRHEITYPVEAYTFPDMGGEGGVEGDRIYNCYYTDDQWREFFDRHGFEQVFHRSDGVLSSSFLFRKRQETISTPIIVNIDDYQCSWLEELQEKITQLEKSDDDEARLWLVSSADYSGMIGFCASLRWEPGSERIRCIQVSNHKDGSKVPALTPGSAEFEELQKKDLVFNIYRDGRWGTYSCLTVTKEQQREERPRENVFAECFTPGDLASLKWFDSPINVGKQNGLLAEGTETCAVYYSGLNSRDLVLANGTRKKDELPAGMAQSDGVLGVEFSGRDSSGRRVMGLCAPPALASTVQCPKTALWSVPDKWTLEEAATVPMAYSIAYYSLMSKARLRAGQRVFVQAGWTAVGQAAIAISQSLGCEVFTLSRSAQDTSVLKANFPKLQDSNICSVDDAGLQKTLLLLTQGKGFDVMISGFNRESATANQRLIAAHGCYLDISLSDVPLDMVASTKCFSVHKIDIDDVIDEQGYEYEEVHELLQAGLKSGVVRPLAKTVYAMGDLVEAFKSLSPDGEKSVIKIRDEEKQKITPTAKTTFPAVYRTSFDSEKSYVIIGGLGGLGVEIADWMITRGARKFILTSRSGITSGFQERKISILRERGAIVEIVPMNVVTEESMDILVSVALNLGPIGGFFNLGMALNDDNLMAQTRESFMKPLEVKVTTTLLMDKVTREEPIRSSLDYFIMFSSVTGSDGNVGQSNYSFGNSFMERLCERRRLEGLPAFAVEMGPVADSGAVGVFGNDGIYCAKAQQRLWDVKATLDYCFSQDHVIVKSYVIPEKSNLIQTGSGTDSMSQQVTKGVAKILGIKDVATVDGDKEFFELGMDSLMSVEIKQLLERDVSVVTSVKELQLMTFNALKATVEAQS